MSVNYCTLDVIQVCEVFECSLQQASFLTQLSYVSPIIMSKHLVSQDSICNLEVITISFYSTATIHCLAPYKQQHTETLKKFLFTSDNYLRGLKNLLKKKKGMMTLQLKQRCFHNFTCLSVAFDTNHKLVASPATDKPEQYYSQSIPGVHA